MTVIAAVLRHPTRSQRHTGTSLAATSRDRSGEDAACVPSLLAPLGASYEHAARRAVFRFYVFRECAQARLFDFSIIKSIAGGAIPYRLGASTRTAAQVVIRRQDI